MSIRSVLKMFDRFDSPSVKPRAKKRKSGKPSKSKKETKKNE